MVREEIEVEVAGLKLTPQKALIMDETAVISDLHLGIEQSMAGTIPRLQIKEIIASVLNLVELYGVKELVVAGDMKNEFSRNMPYEWDDVEEFITKVSETVRIRVLRGNHDNYLATILSKHGIALENYLKLGDWVVVHGHVDVDNLKMAGSDTTRFIIGHEHPSVKVRTGFTTYSFPCFLRATKPEKEVIVLPAFSTMVSGSDIISSESFLSHLLRDFEENEIHIYAVEDRVYYLGKLGDLRKIAGVLDEVQY
jgi:hypothetical protein